MKKVIKLTENELKQVINKSVIKILNESGWDKSGNIPRDGMTGGSWGSKKVRGIYYIDIQELMEILDDETYTDQLYDKLLNIEDSLYFNVQGKYGYDDSVGLSEGYYDISVDTTPCIQAISNLSLFRGDEIYELKQAIETIADRIENGNGENVDWR